MRLPGHRARPLRPKQMKGHVPTNGLWGDAAYEAIYRDHPDGAIKYTHPVTREVFDVDAVLAVNILDRLNRIAGITVMNVCAGHGFGHVSDLATLAFIAEKDMALWLVERLAKDRLVSHLSKAPGLHCLDGGRTWIVVLDCRMFDKEINHVSWWKVVTATLERLVRRYHRQHHAARPKGTSGKPAPKPISGSGRKRR